MSFGFGLSSGGSVLIAQYWGKGDIGRIRKVMRISMQLVFLASLGITVVCLLMPEGILRIFMRRSSRRAPAIWRWWRFRIFRTAFPTTI